MEAKNLNQSLSDQEIKKLILQAKDYLGFLDSNIDLENSKNLRTEISYINQKIWEIIFTDRTSGKVYKFRYDIETKELQQWKNQKLTK